LAKAIARVYLTNRVPRTLIGLLFILIGAITLLGTLGLNTGGVLGTLMAAWTQLAQRAVGIGVFLLSLILIGLGVWLASSRPIAPTRRLWVQIILAEVAFFSFLALIHTLAFGADAYQLTQTGGGGGAVGWVLAEALWKVLGVQSTDGVTVLRLLSVLIWFVLFAFSAFVVASPLLKTERGTERSIVAVGTAQLAPKPAPAEFPIASKRGDRLTEPAPASLRGTQLPLPDPKEARDDAKRARKPEAVAAPKSAPPPAVKSNPVIIKSEADEPAAKGKTKPNKPYTRPDTLPPMDLLKAAKEVKNSDADAKRQADLIETTLSQFGLAGRVTEIRRGPTVTQFGIEPGYLDRGTQNRDKVAQRIRNAVYTALFDSIEVESSVDRLAAVIELPAAIADAREANFRPALKSLLSQLDLSTAYDEREKRSNRAWFEVGADAERKLKIKASQVSALQRELANVLMDRLFKQGSFEEVDALTERFTLTYPAGIAEALDLKDVLDKAMLDMGLSGSIDLNKKPPQATITWQKQAQKVRVGQIAGLQNDFALALAASSIRIEAPIPGRGLVGIEVPNANIGAVDLRSLMEGENFRKIAEKSPLAVALGKDVSGAPINADLGRMPHVLIAGTTGSGKSVCISAITICLAMNNRPEDLKLVMIDPKMVELSRFKGLPHIIGKPESEIDRIPGVLRWVTKEMEARYKKFAELGSRNLQDYNDAMARKKEAPLPRIVVLIDELADLMLQSPIETEKTICRLAQMARATGIHLVVATQRPSVDVVTGLIKANFPARISFAVASATDSRVILDQIGAESLLGRGDMLFLNPEVGSPLRLQGCFVSDKEVESVLKWWEKQAEIENAELKIDKEKDAEYVANKKPEGDAPWETEVAEAAAERMQLQSGKGSSSSGGMDDGAGDDDLIDRAMEIIRASGSVSTSLLQRKLRIGYPRAARLMEELTEMGYVGNAARQAGKGREVLGRDEA
jgi:hypothetical protein